MCLNLIRSFLDFVNFDSLTKVLAGRRLRQLVPVLKKTSFKKRSLQLADASLKRSIVNRIKLVKG